MKASTAVLAIVAALSVLAGVEGTCFLTCTADLILPGNCQIPSNWPVGQGLTKYLIMCETCCSAPGGPLNCSPTDPLTQTFELRQIVGSSSVVIPGSLSVVGTSCCGKTVYQHSGAVALGQDYQLLMTSFFNLILTSFTVVSDFAVTTTPACPSPPPPPIIIIDPCLDIAILPSFCINTVACQAEPVKYVCGSDGEVYSKECIAICNDAYVAFECPKPWDGKGIDMCMQDCFPTEPSCSVLNVDLGTCDCELGWRVDESGECSLITGCPSNVPTGVEFFPSEEKCEDTCGTGPTCDPVDICLLGLCDFPLGWGVDQSGMCVLISGCPDEEGNSPIPLFDSEEECMDECSGDPTCDEITPGQYGPCKAGLGFGVVNGECVFIGGCPSIFLASGDSLFMTSEECEEACEPNCTSIVDPFAFGPCDLVLGYGLFNGQCIAISGCSAGETLLFETEEDCEKACEKTVITISDVVLMIDEILK